MFYIRNLSKGFELKCSCIPIRHSKCHHNSKCGARGVYIHQAASSYSTLFNMIQLFVDVSQCFAGGSGCFYGHEMGISSLKGHRGAGDGCEGAVRSFAATSDGAPSSLHRRLSAGYCRILPDIAGYCWILLDIAGLFFGCLCFTWFYQQYPAISSTIQPKTIQMTTSQSLVDRSRVDSSSEVHWPSSGSQLQGKETDAAIHSDSDGGPV